MAGIGHNKGPTMERGAGWRRFAWRKARADLLPTLPVEIVRQRVRRARELGLDYKTYAGVRASTGRDLVAFLFSSNALRLDAVDRISPERAERLDRLVRCGRLVLVQPPSEPAVVLRVNDPIEAAGAAPGQVNTWSETRARVDNVLGRLPRDGVLVVGETALEREWSMAGRLAGYVTADRYFGT